MVVRLSLIISVLLILSGCAWKWDIPFYSGFTTKSEFESKILAGQKEKCARFGGVFKNDNCDLSNACYKLDKTPVPCEKIKIEK